MNTNTTGLPEMVEPGSKDAPTWLFVIIPLISALVGYGTNIVALLMTFGPVEFYGWKIWQPEGQPLGLIGWQGIIPSKSKIMAGRLMDLFLNRLIDANEVFSRVDPYIITCCLRDGAKAAVRKAIADGLEAFFPATWLSLPVYVKEEAISTLERDTDLFVHLMLDEIKSNILNILDLRKYAERRAGENNKVMADIFSKIGRSECRFIEQSGLVFGFLFGCIQAGVYYVYRGAWLLPVSGLLVGVITNFIALKAIFEPAKPFKLGCYTLQGLFIKRQHAAAAEIAEVAQQEFMRAKFLVDEMINGTRKEEFSKLLDDVSGKYMDAIQPAYEKLAIHVLLGSDGARVIKSIVAKTVKDEIAGIFPACYDAMEECMDIEATLRSRLRDLNPVDFVSVLRPAFQEDEIKLILVGGVLGCLVGLVQQYALFQWFE